MSPAADDRQPSASAPLASTPLWRIGTIFLPLYAANLALGYSFYFAEDSVSAFWPASGLLLAALLLTGWRAWPMLFALSLLSEWGIASLLHPEPLAAELGFGLANEIEAAVGALLVRRFAGPRVDLSSVRHVLILTLLAGTFATAIGALIGAFAIVNVSDVSWASAFQVWWFSDALGVFVVTPTILAWSHKGFGNLSGRRGRSYEVVLFFVLLVVVCQAVLGGHYESLRSLADLGYVVFPFLMWAALRMDERGVGVASSLVALLTIWNADQGRGPFLLVHTETIEAQVLFIQAFLVTVIVAPLWLNAALAERGRTEQRRLAEARRAMAAERFRSLAQVAASAAHDFNNDLTVILGSASLLRVQTERDEILQRADEIEQAVEQSARLADQLLGLARESLPAGSRTNLGSLMADLHPVLERLLGDRVTLGIDVDPSCPEVEMEAGALRQVILNLSTNARDAMPEGGSFTISAGADGGFLKLRLEDTGVGMPSEVAERAFDPFFTTKGESGTGLGLASVFSTVVGAGGSISIDSSPGSGTRFDIVLPLASG